MTFDLEAARALHDRDPSDPGNCLSCRYDSTPGYTGWPCPTALALGATGRTEWDGPLAGAGTLYLPKIIEFDPTTYTTCGAHDPDATADWLPCCLQENHDGAHAGPDGGWWLNASRPLAVAPAFATCGAYKTHSDTGYPCTLIARHPGAHTDHDGDRWDHHPTPDDPAPWPNATDPCPEPSITGNTNKHCIQHRDHDGPHYFTYPNDYTPCRTPRPHPNTTSFCSLGHGHPCDHRNPDGIEWATQDTPAIP